MENTADSPHFSILSKIGNAAVGVLLGMEITKATKSTQGKKSSHNT